MQIHSICVGSLKASVSSVFSISAVTLMEYESALKTWFVIMSTMVLFACTDLSLDSQSSNVENLLNAFCVFNCVATTIQFYRPQKVFGYLNTNPRDIYFKISTTMLFKQIFLFEQHKHPFQSLWSFIKIFFIHLYIFSEFIWLTIQ